MVSDRCGLAGAGAIEPDDSVGGFVGEAMEVVADATAAGWVPADWASVDIMPCWVVFAPDCPRSYDHPMMIAKELKTRKANNKRKRLSRSSTVDRVV